MTRLKIREKYGIYIAEHPDAANEELTPEEAAAYEAIVRVFSNKKREDSSSPADLLNI